MNRHMYFRQQEKNYLAHHGIKGQKWGIRRYQNEDGTLTEEGKRRYSKDLLKAYKRNNRDLIKSDINYIVDQHPEIVEASKKLKELDTKRAKILDNMKNSSKEFKEAEKKAEKLAKKECDRFGEDYNSKLFWMVWEAELYDGGLYDKAEEKYYKNNPEHKKIVEEADKAYSDYFNKITNLVDNILDENLQNVKASPKINGSLGGNIRGELESEFYNRIRR